MRVYLQTFLAVALAATVKQPVLAEPESQRLAIEIDSAHYTACLVNAQGGEDKLPPFARENPTVIQDKDENDYYVAIFATISMHPLNLEIDEPIVEFCHAYLSKNTGRLAEAVPEATYIQSSKCYGMDNPGYDAGDVELNTMATGLGVTTSITLNGTSIYHQTPIAYTPVDLASSRNNVYLDTYHTHYADDIHNSVENSPYYGYFMRVLNTNPAKFNIQPVQPYIESNLNEVFGSNVAPNDVHSCISIESFYSAGTDALTGISILGHYDYNASQTDFLNSFDKQAMRSALKMDSQPQGNINLEDTIYDFFQSYLHPFGAAGYEFEWVPKFRTVTAILDILYLFLIMFQKRINGQYPSARFNGHMKYIAMHIISGMIIIWGGTAIHFYNEANTITNEDDESIAWQAVYYVYGAAGLLQGLSVVGLMPQVRGELRLTIPLYFGAGFINFANAVVLLTDPTLSKLFVLWGSVNMFVYVRAYIVLLSFAHIDWELLYTYSILAAGATVYPLTMQNINVFYILALPVVYAPFHETLVRQFPWLGFTKEDYNYGNQPTDKNISKLTKMLRTMTVDEDYAKKVDELKSDPEINSAIMKIQEKFREKRASSHFMLVGQPKLSRGSSHRGSSVSLFGAIIEEEGKSGTSVSSESDHDEEAAGEYNAMERRSSLWSSGSHIFSQSVKMIGSDGTIEV